MEDQNTYLGEPNATWFILEYIGTNFLYSKIEEYASKKDIIISTLKVQKITWEENSKK